MAFKQRESRQFISVNYDNAVWVQKLAERDEQGNKKELELGDILVARLVGIDVKTTEYNGNEMQKFYFTFADGNEQYVWSPSTSTSLAHNLINRLIDRTAEDLSAPVEISLKLATSQNGNPMVNMWVQYEDTQEPLLWQRKGDEVPKVVYQKVGKKDVKDDSERVDFYVAHAEEIDRVLKSIDKGEQAYNKLSGSARAEEETAQAEGATNKEGLPF